MAPARKTRGRLAGQREVARSRRRVRKPKAPADPSRHRKKLAEEKNRHEAIVEEWVYRFLGNLAAIEADKLGFTNRKPTIRFSKLKRRSKKTSTRRFRSPTPYSWDRVAPKQPMEALQYPMDIDESYDDKLLLPKSQRGSLIPSQTRSSSVAGETKKSLQDRLLLEKINGYIKAGIAEGKRRAKTYVRKALAFALESGYLMPADREGKFLKVSPVLVNQVRSVAVSRMRKQERTRVRKQATKKRTTLVAKPEKKRSAGRKRALVAKAEAEDNDSVGMGEDDDRLVPAKEEDETNDGDGLRKSASVERLDGYTSSDSTSEEAKPSPVEKVSRSSSRCSSRGKRIEEPAKLPMRGRSADLDRKPAVNGAELARPRSASRLMDLDGGFATWLGKQ